MAFYAYAVAAMLVLVVLTKMPVAVAMARSSQRGYDNRLPRHQQSQLTGWGARALAAHQNTFEALIIFVAALLAANIGGALAGEGLSWRLTIVYLSARFIYPVLYITDLHLFRSLVWTVGFASALGLALSPLFI